MNPATFCARPSDRHLAGTGAPWAAILLLLWLALTPSLGWSQGMQTQIPASEYSALVDLYYGTNGSSWVANSGWANPDARIWYGVTTTATFAQSGAVLIPGHVTNLNLAANQLNGSLPTSLGNLSHLTFLNLAQNQLTGSIPSSISGFSNLVYLYLSQNQLTGSIPAALGILPKLVYLYLDNNQLTGGIPAFSGQSRVGELFLNNNLLTGAIPASVAAPRDLTFIDLASNHLGGTFPAWSLAAPSVTACNVASNYIDISPGSPSLANLKRLITEGVALTYEPQSLGYSGTYAGISSTQPASVAGAGYVTLTLEDALLFTAAIAFGGERYALKGVLALDGSYSGTVPNTTITLAFQAVQGSEQIQGTLTQGSVTAQLLCESNPFNAKTNPCPNAGKYTFQLEPLAAGSPPQPQGSGIGTATVSTAGVVSFTGALADGTKVVEGGFVAASAGWAFYSTPYANKGLLTGRLVFENAANTSDADGTVLWLAPPVKSGPYAAGFQGSVDVIGSAYVHPPAGDRVLALMNVEGNGEFTATEGGLSAPLTEIMTLSASNTISPLAAGASELKLSILLSTGAISGSFIPPNATKPATISGVVFQKQDMGFGFFLDAGQSGAATLAANPAFGDGSPSGGLNGDKVPPVVTIKSPTANAKFTGLNAVTFSGTASDKAGVATVEYQTLFNGQITTETTATGTTDWTFSLTPSAAGAYTVFVKAVDVNGNESALVARSITVSP